MRYKSYKPTKNLKTVKMTINYMTQHKRTDKHAYSATHIHTHSLIGTEKPASKLWANMYYLIQSFCTILLQTTLLQLHNRETIKTRRRQCK